MKRISALISILFLLALGTIACQKDKPTTGGGGDNSVTISGTMYSYTEYIYPDQYINKKPLSDVTMTVTTTYYDEVNKIWATKTLFGPTIINSNFSVRFSVDNIYQADATWSKNGYHNDGLSFTIQPGLNLTIERALKEL